MCQVSSHENIGSSSTFSTAQIPHTIISVSAPTDPGYRPYHAGPKCTNCSEPTDTCTDFKLCTNPDRQMSLRDRKKRKVEEREKEKAEETASKGWSLMEIIISAVTGGIGLLAAIGAVIKLVKRYDSTGPSNGSGTRLKKIAVINCSG